MVRIFRSVALAGALTMAALPAFAQDININPLGLDLDPLHVFTPAPPPPAPAPMMKKHHHHHMMMHHKKKMMKKM